MPSCMLSRPSCSEAGLAAETPTVPVRTPPPKEILLLASIPAVVLIENPPWGTEV